MVMTKKSVSARYFLSAYQSCIEEGCEPGLLLASIGLDEECIANPAQRISATAFLDMLHNAEAQLAQAGTGVSVGQNFRPQTFRDIGYVAISCANIVEALKLNTKYQRLTQDIGTTRLVQEGNTAAIVWQPHSDDDEYLRPMTDAVFSGYFTLGLWMNWMGVGNVVSVVQFRHGPTGYVEVFEKAFNCKIQFGAPRNAMVFDAAIAHTPFPQHNPELVAIISKRLDRALAGLDGEQTCGEKVYDTIEALLSTGVPTISHIARLMGMSERTLRRRLSKESISFRQLVKNVRCDSCEIHLKDKNIPLAQLAQKLGFSDQSAFTHAFRAWHGMTPKRYAALRTLPDKSYAI